MRLVEYVDGPNEVPAIGLLIGRAADYPGCIYLVALDVELRHGHIVNGPIGDAPVMRISAKDSTNRDGPPYPPAPPPPP